MTVQGVLLIFLLLSLPLFLTWLARDGRKLNDERQVRVQAARPMKARVVKLAEARAARGASLFQLTLELLPEGAEPIPAQAAWWVRSVVRPDVEPGRPPLAVRLDAQDSRTVYPDFEGAWNAWEGISAEA